MGWLHDGHRALMRQARAAEATTVVSIFVNPRQFNVAADFTKYPRSEARDLAICEAEAVDLVFAPDPTRSTRRASTRSCRSVRSPDRWRARRGPATSTAWRPSSRSCSTWSAAERAYFGQKDAQQVMVIRQMARDLAIATEVVACPTVREPDGLALSSRNVHLSPAERAAAPVLHRALVAARERWQSGERSADALREVMRADDRAPNRWPTPSTSPSPTRPPSTELDRVDGPALLSLAVRFGTTRLIDNEPLGILRATT